MGAVTANSFFKHIDTFFDYREHVYDLSPETIKSNRTDLALFKSFVNAQNGKTISGELVVDFQYYLKLQRDNCGASINRKLFSLRSYANFLQLIGVRNAHQMPFYDVLKIRQGYRKQPNALTPYQIGRLFKAIDDNTILGIRDYAVYALMYQIGLRVGEVHALNLDDLDLKNNTINVMGKGQKPRTLHLNNELVEIICQYLSVRDMFHNHWLTKALFVSKKGNRLAVRTMEDNFKKLLSGFDLKVNFNVTCHTLRHSLASHLNDKEVDILVIQSILGHASTRSTEPYIHPSVIRVRQALEKLPGIKYVKELIRKGKIDLSFQKTYRPRRE